MSAAAGLVMAPKRDERVANGLSRNRAGVNVLARVLCVVATAIGLALLASILYTLVTLGFGGLSATVLTHSMADPSGKPGLLNAIVGTLIQTAIGTVIGTPIGILVGTYLSEYARDSWLGSAVRFVSDVLLSAPSILIGLFVAELLINGHGYSGFAGGVALSIIVIPIVVRTTEDMLHLVPVALREAAVALGAPKWKSIVLICYRAVLDGIATGILIAIARIAGETAPLLFTSFGNPNWTLNVNGAVGSLPTAIFNLVTGSPDDVRLAWVAALIITLGVLALNIVARVALRPRR